MVLDVAPSGMFVGPYQQHVRTREFGKPEGWGLSNPSCSRMHLTEESVVTDVFRGQETVLL